MLSLYIEAPFSVFRTFTAGWYRPSATFLTPSAAYGLLLNLAGIDSRLREEDDGYPGKVPATLTRSGLPAVKLAIGASAVRLCGSQRQVLAESERHPRVATVYQQLHNYPVGSSGGDRAETTFGNKYNITPVRRELLVDLRAIVAIDGNPELERQIQQGLSGASQAPRYGLPFLGDNAFLPDRIEPLAELTEAHWYQRVDENQATVQSRTTRMTVWIDRADLSRTRSELYSPTEIATASIPETAWTSINPP